MHRQNKDFGTLKEASYLKKKKDEVTIRSSAAEYLTYVASVGDALDWQLVLGLFYLQEEQKENGLHYLTQK